MLSTARHAATMKLNKKLDFDIRYFCYNVSKNIMPPYIIYNIISKNPLFINNFQISILTMATLWCCEFTEGTIHRAPTFVILVKTGVYSICSFSSPSKLLIFFPG